MNADDWIILAGTCGLLAASAFFSGTETSLTAASQARMHSLEKGGDERAGIVNSLIERKDRLIGALLIGNNLVNILASALVTSLFLRMFGENGVAIATVVMTVVVVVFGEVLPKSWAISNPDRFALMVAPAANVVVFLLSPFARVANIAVRALLRLGGVKLDETQSMLAAHEEIRGTVAIAHREGAMLRDDRYRLGGILDLHELEVGDVMVHRTKMATINVDDAPAEIWRQIVDGSYTRVPVWKGSADNIVGIIHTKDILRELGPKAETGKLDVMKLSATPWFVPETTPLKDQLNAFLRRKAHMALVVDEYGELKGLITLEDILEEIVGDIADEHDLELSGVQQQADGSVIVDGAVPIRDLNRALDWELPDAEATTVAGLVIHEAQTIPEEKQAFAFHGKRFVVLKREKNRITRIRVRNLPQPAAKA
jgi:Mg2+/Co2+ transporter CorB